ncbi:MAG: hypothetical protein M3N13_03045 [Candidatus Eremiobacteraeota bacterium]|nr:hypothetical protein [Candidatus Eremiobacteraeota bacterium]
MFCDWPLSVYVIEAGAALDFAGQTCVVGGDEAGAIEGGAIEGGAIDGGAIDGGAIEGGAIDGGAIEGGAIDAGVVGVIEAGDVGVIEAGTVDGAVAPPDGEALLATNGVGLSGLFGETSPPPDWQPASASEAVVMTPKTSRLDMWPPRRRKGIVRESSDPRARKGDTYVAGAPRETLLHHVGPPSQTGNFLSTLVSKRSRP